MLSFTPIQLTDKKAIDACLADNTFRACDFCFVNLFTWQSKFKTTFAIVRQTLFIRYQDTPEGRLCYMMPIGKMPLNDAMQLIISDAKENNIPLIIKAVTRRMWICIEDVMPGVFQYVNDSDNDEYIYKSEKLISLTGKKLQPKRNHINRFKKENPDWTYLPLTTDDELTECLEMLDEWEKMNAEKESEDLCYDYMATRLMMDNYHYLQLKGGAIRVNGKIVAFSIGERLTDDTFVVHVEKAFAGITGAYPMINQQFAEHEAAGYTYINREEDMGLEYLRQAKMSYYPDLILQERILTLK